MCVCVSVFVWMSWPQLEDYTMRSMTFQALVGLALKSRPISHEFVEQVAGAMGRMRRALLVSSCARARAQED